MLRLVLLLTSAHNARLSLHPHITPDFTPQTARRRCVQNGVVSSVRSGALQR